MRESRTARAMSVLWVLPALLLVGVFVYFPIVDNFRLSLFHVNSFTGVSRFIGLGNYREAFADPVFWQALRNNVAYAVVSVVVQVGLSLGLAALLEQYVGTRLGTLLRTIYFVPAVISITVAGMLFQFLYDPNIGLVNRLLAAVGLGSWQHAWLGSPGTAIWGIITMSQWQSFGYTTVLFVVAIQKIPRELFEAARVDGAGRLRSFFMIVVPLVREMTTLLVIVTISGAFLVFNEVMVMTAGGPANSSQVLGTLLYQSAFQNNDMGYAAAIGTLIFTVTAVISIAQLVYASRRRVQM